jgi:cytochrome c peroxidase
LAKLQSISPAELPPTPPDVTNRWADDPAAAALGKKFFFETRFSGALLDESNQGPIGGALGLVGDTGKVSCTGCHIPTSGYSDTRTPRRQNSLGAGWTRRRAPSLLDVGQQTFLMWDGHRDSAYSQVFTPMEDSLEFNSSRLFIAQQVARLYKAPYEAIFGPLPASLANFPPVAAADAGCNMLPDDGAHGTCTKPGADDPDVTRIVVNVGKAISAYTRKLKCGPTRFDKWMAGDTEALTEDEQTGATLFVGRGGCIACHSGPYLTDQKYHNVGMYFDIGTVGIPDNYLDPGASVGLARASMDPLNSKGTYSDGDDGRESKVPADLSMLLGAFKTPTLRCVSRRPSYGHTAAFRSLEDAVIFFASGGGNPHGGYVGTSEIWPSDLSADDRKKVVAFLRALDGTGPDPDLMTPPELPPDPT